MRDTHDVAMFMDQLFSACGLYATYGTQSVPFVRLNEGQMSKIFSWQTAISFVGTWPPDVQTRNFSAVQAKSGELFQKIMQLGACISLDSPTFLHTPCLNGGSERTSLGPGGLVLIKEGWLVESTVALGFSLWDEAFALLGLVYSLGYRVDILHAEGGMNVPTEVYVLLENNPDVKSLFQHVFKRQDGPFVALSHTGTLTVDVTWK